MTLIRRRAFWILGGLLLAGLAWSVARFAGRVGPDGPKVVWTMINVQGDPVQAA